MLSLRGLGKDYGDRVAVAGIDLEVAKGEILGLLGPNGAGKTTTISMACGVTTPSRGSVTIGGADLAREPYAAKRKLGLVPQDLALYEELTARQNLAYFAALYGVPKSAPAIDRALDLAGLADRAKEPVKQFSGGMKRRLNLAAGLVHEPELLVLDEPTVGVDPQSRAHIFDAVKALRAKGLTVVYTSHYMEEVEALCDRVAIMDGGKLVALGTIPELVGKHGGKGVTIELEDGRVLTVTPAGALAPELAEIEKTGRIVRIESREANLEAAFLALTGRGLRDQS
jgi:ABC-2 type transport system ATP-binding protein